MGKSKNFSSTLLAGICLASTLVFCVGCDQQQTSEAIKEAEAAAEGVADAAEEMMEKGSEMAGEAVEGGKEMASEAAEKGKELASELGEKAMAFVGPLKEKIGGLEGLKDSPEKLKQAVVDLIASIKAKTEDMQLPEAMSKALDTVKEKLMALKEYLEGEFEQSQIDEKVSDLVASLKSGLGMAQE